MSTAPIAVPSPPSVQGFLVHVREVAERDPEKALQVLDDLVLLMVAELPEAMGALRNPEVDLRTYGRAHT
jgi:hypothetical protein